MGGSGGMGNEVCDDAWKRCDHVFSFPDSGQSSVEVRGNFPSSDWTSGIAMVKQGAQWSAHVDIPYNIDVQYKFVLNGTMWVNDPANPLLVPDGFGGQNSLLQATQCIPYTCDKAGAWRDEVLYYIHVDRFVNGDPLNDYGSPVGGIDPAASYQGGDWKGVQSKIDAGYFNQLGVTGLVLNIPLDNFEGAGMVPGDTHLFSAYHGHWPKQHASPEEHFGTMAELKALVTSAHGKGLEVILEYTGNHVHQSAPIYSQNPTWFWPNSNGMGGNCVCGDGCMWGNPVTDERCWFTDYLPDWNHQVVAARTYVLDNMMWWVAQTGVDGFKVTAINHIASPWLTDLRTRARLDVESVTNKHFYLLGDHFTADPVALGSRVNTSKMLDGQLDLPLRAEIVSKVLMREGSMQDLESFLAVNDSRYPYGIMSKFLGIDTLPRAIHFADDTPLWSSAWNSGSDRAWAGQPTLPTNQSAFERLANAFTLIMTTGGIPIVYYGDEIGMPGAGDPDNRRFMNWSNLSANQIVLRTHLEKLGQIRKNHAALRRGKRTALSASVDTMAYEMKSTDPADTVYVVINRGDQPNAVTNLPAGTFTNLLNGQVLMGPMVMLPPRSSMILAP